MDRKAYFSYLTIISILFAIELLLTTLLLWVFHIIGLPEPAIFLRSLGFLVPLVGMMIGIIALPIIFFISKRRRGLRLLLCSLFVITFYFWILNIGPADFSETVIPIFFPAPSDPEIRNRSGAC